MSDHLHMKYFQLRVDETFIAIWPCVAEAVQDRMQY